MDVRSRVDVELLPALEGFLARMGPRFMTSRSPSERRAVFAAFVEQQDSALSSHPDVARQDFTLPSRDEGRVIAARLFVPSTVPVTGTILYIHGGGFTLGSAAMEDVPAAALATASGCIVLSPDYRLAPEHPFPAAIHDCYDALTWLASNETMPHGRILLYGASAGGGLCASLSLLTRDLGGPAVTGQILNYPMLDDRSSLPSFALNDGLDMWDTDTNRLCWSQLLGESAGGAVVSPYAAAARATSLRDLPPTFMMVGELDVLLDEAIEFTRRLIGDGVPAEMLISPGSFHSFELMGSEAKVSRRAAACRLAALRQMLGMEDEEIG